MIAAGDELANETMLLKKTVEFSYRENVDLYLVSTILCQLGCKPLIKNNWIIRVLNNTVSVGIFMLPWPYCVPSHCWARQLLGLQHDVEYLEKVTRSLASFWKAPCPWNQSIYSSEMLRTLESYHSNCGELVNEQVSLLVNWQVNWCIQFSPKKKSLEICNNQAAAIEIWNALTSSSTKGASNSRS